MPSILKSNASLRVLGVDPGTRITGWGLIEAKGGVTTRVAWGCLRSSASSQRYKVLAGLASGLQNLVEQWQPDVVAVETPFISRFQRASLQLAETRGALLAALGQYRGVVSEYEPARVKAWVVGNGRAEKQQVAWVVKHVLGIQNEVQADAADALAVALCHLFQEGALGEVVVSGDARLAH